MPAVTRPQKITLAEMRAAGVRGLLICCSDYKCALGKHRSRDAAWNALEQMMATRH